MASFESLADASLAAAMNVQRFLTGQTKNLSEYDNFIQLLETPLFKDNDYKLLTDARKLPIYRRAWSDAFGNNARTLSSDQLLKQISSVLKGAKPQNKHQRPDMASIVDFCLALNRIFLEEDAEIYEGAYRSRVSHGTF